MSFLSSRETDSDATALDLRSGRSVWELDATPPSPSQNAGRHLTTDVVIVGGGITGAFLAERFTGAGRDVIVLDRHEPQQASTAASTALLQWEIDAPMIELEDTLGFDAAAAIYRASAQTVKRIGSLVQGLHLPCDFDWRSALFFAGNALDPHELRDELALRLRAGLPSRFLDSSALERITGFQRAAALLSSGSAEVDPIKLARGLLNTAIARGAKVISPIRVDTYDSTALRVHVTSTEGTEVEGNILILANGYEMPSFIPADSHRIVSTWALATKPQRSAIMWPDRSLIWEASEPYLYARTSVENRIIVGGEDEPITDAATRDGLLPAKTKALLTKLAALLPGVECDVDAAWTGFFGETDDGLPMIGRVPGYPRCYAAFGYGGNGITFSALAADMIEQMVHGENHPLGKFFAVDR